MPNIYNDILWQTLLGDNEVEICLQPTDTELPTDIYQPTNSTLKIEKYKKVCNIKMVQNILYKAALISFAVKKGDGLGE